MRFQNDGKERRNHVTTRQSYFSQNGVCSVTGRVTYVPHRSTRGHDAHVDTTHTWTRRTHGLEAHADMKHAWTRRTRGHDAHVDTTHTRS
jgi:hypothetical protein